MEILKNISPRKYQEEILKTCIDKNCLVVIPTGLGKTLIALMLTVERMKAFPGEKVLFLAPTKPLAEQHLIYFKNNLPELFGDMQLFTGSVQAAKRKKIWDTADIVFSTPQCIANDLKKGLYSLENVCLLVEDEAHRCVKNYDYNFIAKKYLQQSANTRILGLTASPGSEASKIKEICKNLAIEEVELRTRESPDVKQYLQERKFEKEFVDLPEEFKKVIDSMNSLFNKHVAELKNRRVLWKSASKTELIKLQRKIMANISKGKKDFNLLIASSVCATAIKIMHAMELLETQTVYGFNKYLKELFRQAAKKENKGSMRLVAKPEFNYSFMKSNEFIEKKIEHPKISKLVGLVGKEYGENNSMKIIIFTQFRDTANLISKKLNEINGIRSKVFIGQTKKSGDGVEGLSQKQQKRIISEFSSNEVNVLCATSIGEEGLDIPEVNTVIFYEPVPSAIRAIQRAGRTARLIEGKLIMLITKGTRDETYFYVSKAKEKRMHKAIDLIKKNLSGDSESKKEIQRKIGQ